MEARELWILYERVDYDSDELLGVFSSLERAREEGAVHADRVGSLEWELSGTDPETWVALVARTRRLVIEQATLDVKIKRS